MARERKLQHFRDFFVWCCNFVARLRNNYIRIAEIDLYVVNIFPARLYFTTYLSIFLFCVVIFGFGFNFDMFVEVYIYKTNQVIFPNPASFKDLLNALVKNISTKR